MKNRNYEGYADPTATEAIRTISKEEQQVHKLVQMFRDMVALAGFVVVGKIELKHKKSGRRYR